METKKHFKLRCLRTGRSQCAASLSDRYVARPESAVHGWCGNLGFRSAGFVLGLAESHRLCPLSRVCLELRLNGCRLEDGRRCRFMENASVAIRPVCHWGRLDYHSPGLPAVCAVRHYGHRLRVCLHDRGRVVQIVILALLLDGISADIETRQEDLCSINGSRVSTSHVRFPVYSTACKQPLTSSGGRTDVSHYSSSSR